MTNSTMKTRKLQAVTQIEIVKREEGAPDTDTFDIVWTTGSKGLRYDWDLGRYYEELEVSEAACDLSRMNNGAAPFLVQHANHVWAVAGVIERAWIQDGKGYATVKPSVRAEMQEIVRDIKAGVLKNVSVGYHVTTYRELTQPGDDIRTLLAVKWTPMEASIVAIGFDPNAQTSVRSKGEEEQPHITEVIVSTPATAPAPTPITTREPATPPVQVDPPAQPPATPVVDTKAVEAERSRASSITTAVAAAGLGAEVASELISREITMEDASKEIFRLAEEAKKKPKTPTKEREMTKRELVEAALLNRVDAKRFKVDQSNPFKRAKLLDLFAAIVERKGDESDSAFAKRAVILNAGLSEVLANVANKLLGHESGEKFTYDRIATHQSLRDFKPTSIILFSGVNLAEKTEGGDYADATLADSDEVITLAERGVLVRISQKAIINDDIGAFKLLNQMSYRAGPRDIEKQMYAMLNLDSGNGPVMKDTKRLFHTDHGNILSDGEGPNIAGVEAANAKMAAFTDGSGEPLDLRTKILLVGTALEVMAKQVASSKVVPGSVDAVNPYAGELEVVVSSRIPGLRWYALADKEDINPLVYGTLEGMAEPNVEAEVDFKSSNFQLKVEYPNCVGVGTHKGIIRGTYVPPEPEPEP